MKTGLIDSVTPDHAIVPEGRSLRSTAIAVICAIIITALLSAGYAYLRKRHAQQSQVAAQQPGPTNAPKGPPKAQIFVDDAMLKGAQTLIGGSVKNISGQPLANLSVVLELRRRKDGSIQEMSAPVEPAQLDPQQEGRYSLMVSSAEYGSVKLNDLRGGAASSPIVYTTAPGQKRPPERLEPKAITVRRPAPRPGDFLNTPDNPGRVP